MHVCLLIFHLNGLVSLNNKIYTFKTFFTKLKSAVCSLKVFHYKYPLHCIYGIDYVPHLSDVLFFIAVYYACNHLQIVELLCLERKSGR